MALHSEFKLNLLASYYALTLTDQFKQTVHIDVTSVFKTA